MAEHHDDVREPGDKLPGRMYPAVGGSGEIAETAGGRLEAYHRWPGWPEDEGDPPMIITHHAVGQSPDFYQKIKPSLAEALVEMEEKNPMVKMLITVIRRNQPPDCNCAQGFVRETG
jgi:hypothetical protein